MTHLIPLTDVEEIITLPAVERFDVRDLARNPDSNGVITVLTGAFLFDFILEDGGEELGVPEACIVWSHTADALRPAVRQPTALAHLWEMICRQPCGEPGELPNDGSYATFEVKNRAMKKPKKVILYFDVLGRWVLHSVDDFPPKAKFFWTLKALSE